MRGCSRATWCDIPPVGPQVAVAGSVKTPAIYELNREKSVGDVVQMGGGLSAVADVGRASLERIKERSSRETFELKLDAAGLATVLNDGDVLKVLTVNPKFGNAVTLRGNVATRTLSLAGPGMRLREVIPDRDSLVTRDYWKKHNTLGFTPPGEVAGGPSVEAVRKKVPVEMSSSAPDINWSYAVIERQNPANLTTDLIPFHLGKLVLENDDTENLELGVGRRGDHFLAGGFPRGHGAADPPGAAGRRVCGRRSICRASGRDSGTTGAARRRPHAAGLSVRRGRRANRPRWTSSAGWTSSSRNWSRTWSIPPPTGPWAPLPRSGRDCERATPERARHGPTDAHLEGHRPDCPEPGSGEQRSCSADEFSAGRWRPFCGARHTGHGHVLGAIYNQNSFAYAPNLRVADFYARLAGQPGMPTTGACL